MTVVMSPPAASRRPPEDDRRAHIVAAAESAFVRHGFHATTMQHVAEAAGMSAGNLYRYFPSKEAIVEGLCVMDQAERGEKFARLTAGGDFVSAIRAGLLEHFASPPAKAQMILEIWAEAGRNPRIAALTRRMDAEVLGMIAAVMEEARSKGAAPANLDVDFAARMFFTLVAGLFKRSAVEPDFNPSVEIELVISTLKALFAGGLAPAARPEI